MDADDATTDQMKLTAEPVRWQRFNDTVGAVDWNGRSASDNHHNALACPYCNPDRLVFFTPDTAKALADCIEVMDAREQAFSDIQQAKDAAEAALTALRSQVTQLCEQWDEMVTTAMLDSVIPGDEVGHAARWTAVEMCARELRQLLPPTDADPQEPR